jgi:hypothetical protein
MKECFLTILQEGFLRGGVIGTFTEPVNYDNTILYWLKFIHDFLFFVVTMFISNLVAGLVIDSAH